MTLVNKKAQTSKDKKLKNKAKIKAKSKVKALNKKPTDKQGKTKAKADKAKTKNKPEKTTEKENKPKTKNKPGKAKEKENKPKTKDKPGPTKAKGDKPKTKDKPGKAKGKLVKPKVKLKTKGKAVPKKGKGKTEKGKPKKANEKHKKKPKMKVKLRRFPKKRKFTDALWMIPFVTWILFTSAMCALCIMFGDFTWLHDITSINCQCSDMHYHFLAYLLNYESYLLALTGSLVLSMIYAIAIQYVSNIFIQITWYLSLLTTTTYILCLWFIQPEEQKLSCGQSVFSISVTLAYFAYVFLMFNNRRKMPLVDGLHRVTRDIYQALPTFRIGLITFIFQFICVTLNFISMGVTVGVLYAGINLTSKIVTVIYSIFFMLLEGWMFLFIIYCNQLACGYCVGLWYFAKNKKKIKRIGTVFVILFKHFATLATGSIFLSLHRLFQPVVNSLNSGTSTGLEGIVKTVLSIFLNPFKNTYDIVNPFGFYMVAIYGAGYYPSMLRAFNLNKVGEEHMLHLTGDIFVTTSILFISPVALFLGLSWDPAGRMRWWQNMILLFFTGMWVSLSFLLTFKFMNTAFYMCLCMDVETHVKKKKPIKFPKTFENYLKSKTEFGLMWRLKITRKKKKKPVFDKSKKKKATLTVVNEKHPKVAVKALHKK